MNDNTLYLVPTSKKRKCENCGKTTKLIEFYTRTPICSIQCLSSFINDIENFEEKSWIPNFLHDI